MPTTTTTRALPRPAQLTVATRVTDGPYLFFQVGRAELESGGCAYDVALAYDVRTGAPLVQVRETGSEDPGVTYVVDVNALLRAALTDHLAHAST